MTPPDVTLAQIGCGYWGPNLLRNFTELPGSYVKYVVEASDDRRRYVRENFPRTTPTADLNTALADPAVQAVLVATPAHTHFALALRALQAGKHVFVEKPLAMSVAEVDTLAAEATRRRLTLMAGHTFLYNPAVLALKALVDSGELGRIYYLYTQRLNLGVIRADVNALWNLAPHDISICNFLLGASPLAVTAHGTAYLQPGIEDVVFAHLEYPGEVRASIHVSWLDPNKTRKVTLVGSRKMVVYDDVAVDKLTIYDKGIDSFPPSVVSGPLPFDQPGAHRMVYRSGEIQIPTISSAEPLRAEAADFLAAISEKRPPRTDATSARPVVATLQAATLSLKENSRRVALAEILPSLIA
jgi:predicted dehydrogenase